MATKRKYLKNSVKPLNPDLNSFSVGFLSGVLFTIACFLVPSLYAEDTTKAEVYVCTYSVVQPESKFLAAPFCWIKNDTTTGDPCVFAIESTYIGTIPMQKEYLAASNDHSARSPNGSKYNWTLLKDFARRYNDTNAAIEKGINPFD